MSNMNTVRQLDAMVLMLHDMLQAKMIDYATFTMADYEVAVLRCQRKKRINGTSPGCWDAKCNACGHGMFDCNANPVMVRRS